MIKKGDKMYSDEKTQIKIGLNNAIEGLERDAKIELCTEKGINLAREYFKKRCPNHTGYISMAMIAYSATVLAYEFFLNWWNNNFHGELKTPDLDDNVFTACSIICSTCSPKSEAKTGAGAGALGGFLLGGIFGAAIGAVLGGYGGQKMSEEATGEKYYSILRESLEYLFNSIKNETNKLLEYML